MREAGDNETRQTSHGADYHQGRRRSIKYYVPLYAKDQPFDNYETDIFAVVYKIDDIQKQGYRQHPLHKKLAWQRI